VIGAVHIVPGATGERGHCLPSTFVRSRGGARCQVKVKSRLQG
jgi:hypothetical protein